jgi:hypothetical protein
MFRDENPDRTERVATDVVLQGWCKVGDKDVCARTRCIVDQDGTTIATAENAQSFDLVHYIPKFYDIDKFQGGGVTYNGKRLDEKTMDQIVKAISKAREDASISRQMPQAPARQEPMPQRAAPKPSAGQAKPAQQKAKNDDDEDFGELGEDITFDF